MKHVINTSRYWDSILLLIYDDETEIVTEKKYSINQDTKVISKVS